MATQTLLRALDETEPCARAGTAGRARGGQEADRQDVAGRPGERKAMGSYYTPAFIVDYIVEHTIGPLAEEAAQRTEALADELRELQKRLDKTQSPESLRNLTAQRDDLRRGLTEPYLSLRILDPAMGSGHFLVGAADFLSLAMATDPNLPEPEDLGDEEPQVHYKRLIVEQCLCGVDLNPLAVELAKLSLWLHTVSRDKALSFLDYHLRCGNSLIGAWVEKDLTREPPRFTDRGKRVNADSAQTVLGFTQALGRKHLQPMLDALRQITQSPGTTAQLTTNRMATAVAVVSASDGKTLHSRVYGVGRDDTPEVAINNLNWLSSGQIAFTYYWCSNEEEEDQCIRPVSLSGGAKTFWKGDVGSTALGVGGLWVVGRQSKL